MTIDTETGRAAEQFNDNLTRLGQAQQGLANQLMRELLPAMNLVTDAFVAAAKESGGVNAHISALVGFMQGSALTAFQALAVVGSDVAFVFKMIGGEIGVWAAQLAALARGDFKGFKLIGDEWTRDAAQARKDLDDFQARIMGLKEAVGTQDGGAMDMGIGLAGVFNKKPNAPQSEDSGKVQKEVEFIARQWQEAAEEEIKLRSEVAHWTAHYRNLQLEQERAIDAQRLEAIYAFHDAEQEAAIAQGEALLEASGLAHSVKLEQFRLSLLTEEQAEIEQYQKRLERLQEFSDAELELLGGLQGAKERMEQEHQNKMLDIGGRGPASLNKLRKNYHKLDLEGAGAFMGQMSLLMNSKSKELFEIGKAAAIGETLINTYKAAMGAYSAMASIPYVGPALGAAAAAAAIAAGMAQVSAIRSQQYGSGGGAVGTFPANPTTGQPTGDASGGGDGERRRGPTTIINLQGGEHFSRDQVRSLIEQIAEDTRDGGTVMLAN